MGIGIGQSLTLGNLTSGSDAAAQLESLVKPNQAG